MNRSRGLFDPVLPDGFQYRAAFVPATEELALLACLGRVSFSIFEMRGVAARRRVAFFGQSYGREAVPAIPDFLVPLRAAVAAWAGIAPEAYAMALINEYPPGAPIGWHRDAPQYEHTAGISLLSGCRMRFRPYRSRGKGPAGPHRATHETVLEPRSAYLITGKARTSYEHQIPPVHGLRYSITFRTLRTRVPE